MNRSFITDLTPARARLLRLMHRHTEFALPDEVLECAKQNQISRAELDSAGLESHEEREAVQFIIDSNFRAGIPVSVSERDRADRIIDAALRIAGIGYQDVAYVSDYHSRSTTAGGLNLSGTSTGDFITLEKFDFETLVQHRRKVLIINLDHLDQSSNHELMAKMFPRIICVGALMVQYSFAFGSQNSTTTRMGELLYPAVEMSIRSTPWKQTERRSMVAMGVYPEMIDDFSSAPKKMSKKFILPRSL